MKRIIVDLTDLELWGGQHGGTQRVVYGIAKYFYLQPDSVGCPVVFVAFSSNEKRFHEISFQPIYDRVEAHKQQSPAQSSAPGISLQAKLKYRLRPYVPERVRRSSRARRVALLSLGYARSSAAVLKSQRAKYHSTSSQPTMTPIHLQSDDTVLVMGKPWDNPAIQTYLTMERQKTGLKLVQVVYDMIIPLNPQLHHPSLFKTYTQHMFEAISASDTLLPISQSSANDVIKFSQRLRLPIPDMKVIRLGDEVIDIEVDNVAKPHPKIEQQFIACVGTIEIRKNHMLLYYVYKRALEEGKDLPQLVIVGSRGWLSGDFQYLVEHDPALADKIIILDTINDASLAWIYKHCMFTVYPSMYEGWGLPVAESLAVGKLCIASNSSSVPEIAGDLIDYFSPFDAEECMKLIDKYQNTKLLSQKEKQIRDSYVSHTWEDTFKQIKKYLDV